MDNLVLTRKQLERRREAGHDELAYPGTNAAALALITGDRNATEWNPILNECAASAEVRRQRVQDFWSRVAVPDILLLQCLFNDDLESRQEGIVAAYKNVIDETGTSNEFGSMTVQLDLLADKLRIPTLTDLRNRVRKMISIQAL